MGRTKHSARATAARPPTAPAPAAAAAAASPEPVTVAATRKTASSSSKKKATPKRAVAAAASATAEDDSAMDDAAAADAEAAGAADGEEEDPEEEEEESKSPIDDGENKSLSKAKGQKRARSNKKEKKGKASEKPGKLADTAAAAGASPARRSSRAAHPRQDLGFVVAAFDSEDEENLQRSDSSEEEEGAEGEKEKESAAEENGTGEDASEAASPKASSGKKASKGAKTLQREFDELASSSSGDDERDSAYGSSGADDDDDANDENCGSGGGGRKKRASSPSPRKGKSKVAASPKVKSPRAPRAKAAGASAKKPRAKKEPKAGAKGAKGKAKKKKVELAPIDDVELLAALELVEDSHAAVPKVVPGLSKAAIALAKEAASTVDASCCSLCASRAAHRAVESNNLKLMDALCADYAHVASPLLPWSADVSSTPLQKAIVKGDRFMVRKLLHELNLAHWAAKASSAGRNRHVFGYGLRQSDEEEEEEEVPEGQPRPATAKRPAVRVGLPINQLEKQSTGKASYVAYGHRVAAVNVSRGGKEGNNAFVGDQELASRADSDFAEAFRFLMAHGSNPDLIDVFAQTVDSDRTTYENAQAQLAGGGAGGAAGARAGAPANKPGLAKQKSQLKDALAAAAAAASGAAPPAVVPVFDVHLREDTVHSLLSSGAFKLAVAAGNLPLVRRALEFSQKRSGGAGLTTPAVSAEYGHSRIGGLTKIFNEVVATDGSPLSEGYKAASVTKKGGGHSDSLTPCHLAAINPDVQYIKALADVIGVQTLLQVTDEQSRGPIFYAAACASPEPLRWLISQGANVFERDRKMMTPLEVAVQAGRWENIPLLVPQVPNKSREAAEEEEKQEEEGAEAGEGSEAMHSEAEGKGEEEEDGGDDEDDDGSDAPPRKKRKAAPKKKAAKKKAPALLAMSKEPVYFGATMPSPQSSINAKHKKTGATLLQTACQLGDAKVVSALLAAGADVFAANKEKQTGLVLACQKGHLQVVKALHRHILDTFGALPDAKELASAWKRSFLMPDKLHRLPIFHAVKNGHFALVKYLLTEVGMAPDAMDSSDNNLLHYAAAYGWADIVKLLLVFVGRADEGTPVALLAGAPSIWKTTPLFVAMLKGHLAVSAAILGAPHVDVNARDSDGLTILHHVVQSKNRGLEQTRRQLHFLIDERNADAKLKDPKTLRNILHMLAALPYTPPAPAKPAAAAAEEEEKKQSDAPSSAPKRSKSKSKEAAAASPATVSAATGPEDASSDASLAEMFLAQGLDVNLVDEAGHSALMLALDAQNFPLVTFLLGRGARVNLSYGVGRKHETPLMRLLGLVRPRTKAEENYETEVARQEREKEQRRHWGPSYNRTPTPEEAAQELAKKTKYLRDKATNDAQFDAQRRDLFQLMLDKGRETSDPLRDPLSVGEVGVAAAGGRQQKRERGDEDDEGDEDGSGGGSEGEEDEDDEDGGSDEEDGDGSRSANDPPAAGGDSGKVRLDADGVPIATTLHFLNGRDQSGATLLFHCLRSRGADSLLRLLLAYASAHVGEPGLTLDLNSRDSDGRTVLFHAVAAQAPAQPVQLLRILLDYAAQARGGSAGVTNGSKPKGKKAAAAAAAAHGADAPALELHTVSGSGVTLPAAMVRLACSNGKSSASPVLLLQLLAELASSGGFDLSSTGDFVVLHRRPDAPPNPPPVDPMHPDVVPPLFVWDHDALRRSGMLEKGVAGAVQPEGVSDKAFAEMQAQWPHYTVERQSFFSFLVRSFAVWASEHSLVANPAFPKQAPVTRPNGRAFDPAGRPRREYAAWIQAVRLVLQAHKNRDDGGTSLRALVLENSFGAPAGFHDNLLHIIARHVDKLDLHPLLQLLADFIPRDALKAAGAQMDRDGCTPLLRLLRAGLPISTVSPLASPQPRVRLQEALKLDLAAWLPEDDEEPKEEAAVSTGADVPAPTADASSAGNDAAGSGEEEDAEMDGEDEDGDEDAACDSDGSGDKSGGVAPLASPPPTPFALPFASVGLQPLGDGEVKASEDVNAGANAHEPAALKFVLSYPDLHASLALLAEATSAPIDAGIGAKWWDPKTLQRKKVAAARAPKQGDEHMVDVAAVEAPSSDSEDDRADEDDDEATSKAKKTSAAGNKILLAAAAASKKKCPYGAKCYRKNPVHFTEFSHPGDAAAVSASGDGASLSAKSADAAAEEGELIIPEQSDLAHTALHLAVLVAAEPLVAFLLTTLKASPLARDYRQRIPLHLAAEKNAGSVAIPTLLLHSQADAQVLARDADGAIALSKMCQASSKVALAALLLRHLPAEQVAMADNNGRLALHFAVNYSCRRHGDDSARGYEESFGVESLLLRKGADINAVDGDGRTCLHYAFVPIGSVYVATGTGALDPIEVVSDICAVQAPGAAGAAARALSNASAAGGIVRAASFIHKSVECFVRVDVADRFGRTPLLYAAALGAQISCKYLQQRAASLKTLDGDGNGVYQHALLHLRSSLAVDLIDHEVDLQRPIHPALQQLRLTAEKHRAAGELEEAAKLDKAIQTASLETQSTFGFVLQHGWIGLGYLMIDAGLSICVAVKDALSSHLLSLVWTLLQKTSPSKLLEVEPSAKRNLFHLLAGYRPKDAAARTAFEDTWSLRFAELLAGAGVDLDAVESVYGYTPLHIACMRGHTALVKFLLSRKVRTDVRALNGYTPFLLAAAHRQIDMIQLLLQHDANIFSRAEQSGLSQGLDGLTALHWAVHHNQLELTALLLRLGAKLDPVLQRGENNFRPHWWKAVSLEDEQADASGALAASRRHLRAKNSNTRWTAVVSFRREGDLSTWMQPLSPLQVALCAPASSLNWSMVKVLLAYGANPSLRVLDWRLGREAFEVVGGAGTSVTTHAALQGHTRLLALLLHEADPVEVAAEKKRLATVPVPLPPAPTLAQGVIRAAPKGARTANALGSTRDALGRTIVHRLVSPLGVGQPSPEDVSLLRLVVQASRNGINEPVDLEAKDNEGGTALFYALQQGSGRMKEALLSLGAKPDAKVEAAAKAARDKARRAAEVDWNAPGAFLLVDAAADAAAVEAAEAARLEELEEHGAAPVDLPKVDPLAGELCKTCKVYADPSLGVLDVYMTCTEVNAGPYGKHAFYKMSVLWNALQSLPILWTRWGRVGEDGQYQRTPFATLDATIAEFQKIFKSKSGNSWAEGRTKKTFKPIDNKYHVQWLRAGKKDQSLLMPLDTIVARLDADKLPAVRAPAPVQALVRLFCDTGRMHTLLRKLGFQDSDSEEGGGSSEQLLSRLSKATLEAGMGKLREVALLVPKLKLIDASLQAQHTLRQQVERQIEMKAREAHDTDAPSDDGAAADDGGAQDMDMGEDEEEDGEDEEGEEQKSSKSRKARKGAAATPKKRGGAAAAAGSASARKASVDASPEPELSLAPISEAISRLQSEKGAVEDELSALSNAFFQLVPQPSFASSAIRSITRMEDVHKYVAQLLQFTDVGATARLLLGCQLRPYDLHPIDYAYSGLGVRLSPLSRKDPTFALVERYVHVQTDLRQLELWNVFALERRGEVERFEATSNGIANRTLLWHGSGLVNFNGILSQGLRIAPPEADASGLAFGKGIYTADSFSKSLAYCRDANGSFGNLSAAAAAQSRYTRSGGSADEVDPTTSKCLLLCEVALGTVYEAHEAEYMESAKPGTHSTKALGMRAPDPARSVVTPDGLIVPSGPLVSVQAPEGWRPRHAGQQYASVGLNEYIVYDEGQLRTRFLVQVGPPRARYLRRLDREAKRKAKREQAERNEREQAFAGDA